MVSFKDVEKAMKMLQKEGWEIDEIRIPQKDGWLIISLEKLDDWK